MLRKRKSLEKEDWRGEKAVGTGMGKDFAASPAPRTESMPNALGAAVQCTPQSPQKWEGVLEVCMRQPAINTSP